MLRFRGSVIALPAPIHESMWKTKNVATKIVPQIKGDALEISVIDRSVTCDHCDNMGYVLLDETDTAAPCPMCKIGFAKHVSSAADGESYNRFWSLLDIRSVTWNRGCTLDHWKCYRCRRMWSTSVPNHQRQCHEIMQEIKTTPEQRMQMLRVVMVKAARAASIDRDQWAVSREEEVRRAAAKRVVLDLAAAELKAMNVTSINAYRDRDDVV